MDNPIVDRRASPPDTVLSSESFSSEPPSPAARKKTTIIEPASGFQAINFRELWQFRDLLITLAGRDIKLRYRQTALGVIWVILQPLVAAGILSFVFGQIGKLSTTFIFSYVGLLGWNVFNNILSKCSAVLLQNTQLISKVYFPRLMLPLSTVFSALLDFGVALVLVPILMLMYHVTPTLGLILFPLWILLIASLALGLGLYTAALAVSYRDVQYVLPVIIPFLMYASPVGYAVSNIPIRFRAIYHLNPMASLLEALRWSLLGRGEMHPLYLTYAALVSCLVFLGGAYAFKNMERRFADVI